MIIIGDQKTSQELNSNNLVECVSPPVSAIRYLTAKIYVISTSMLLT